MEKLYKFLGGRKMTLTIVLLLTTFTLLMLNKTGLYDYGMFIVWIYGIYTVGNSVEHMSPHIDPSK